VAVVPAVRRGLIIAVVGWPPPPTPLNLRFLHSRAVPGDRAERSTMGRRALRGAPTGSSRSPSREAREPTAQRTADLRPEQLGDGRATPLSSGGQGADRRGSRRAQARGRHWGGVGTDDGMKDRNRARPVRPGHRQVGHMFQPHLTAVPFGVLGNDRGGRLDGLGLAARKVRGR